MTSQFLIDDLKRDEGCKLEAYPDPRSGGEPWTIGYGCTDEGIGPGTKWTQAKADAELAKRVDTLKGQLTKALPWMGTLSDLRQDVLVNMAYNLGLNGLLAFHHTLADIEGGKYVTASIDMLQSAWAREVGARATRLATQMRTGIHQE